MTTAPQPSSSAAPFLVLGGGPSGLACAWALARAGHRVTVLEREGRPGGLCATYEQNGFRFDLGGHRIVTADAALTRRIHDLLGEDLLVQERRSVVLHGGRAFRYPLEAGDLIRSLGVRENARAFGGYFAARMRERWHPSPDRTFEDWVASRFGRPLYETFFGPYTEKLWGIPAREISADWAAQRIGLLHLGDAALRMIGARRTAVRTYARRYHYPRLGMGSLFDRIAQEIVRLGGEVVRDADVTGLVLEDDARDERSARQSEGAPASRRVRAVRARVAGREVELACAGVYATIPLTELARMVAAGQPEGRDVEGVASRLRFRGVRFLNIALGRPRVSPNTWMYVADPRFRTARIQEPTHRSPAMAPPGKTSLMLEIPCDPGDDVWSEADDALLARGLDELDRLGVRVRDDVEGAFTVRARHGYPVYHVGYERDRQVLLGHLAAVANLRAGGRQGLFRYLFLDAAMEMGEVAAVELGTSERSVSRIDAVRRENALLEIQAITST